MKCLMRLSLRWIFIFIGASSVLEPLAASIVMAGPTSTQSQAPRDGQIEVEYANQKEKLTGTDIKSREVMAKIYEINTRMKRMSRRRDNLNNRVISIEGNIKSMAREIARIEIRISSQRDQLKSRLRAIYMLGDDSVVRIVFSAASAQDIDQTLKYLKLISDNDYKQIKSFERNLKLLSDRRERLKREVRSLLTARESLKKQETRLNRDQITKSRILNELKRERDLTLKNIETIRRVAQKENNEDILDLSFFEKKGKLRHPVAGELVAKFGLIEDVDFKYRLGHKGHRYKVNSSTAVRSVYDGSVAFVGHVHGYGSTVIVDHGDHYYSVYSGAESVRVIEGQRIKADDLIAKVNEKNDVYFEIRHFSNAIDPQPWLAKNNNQESQQ